MIIWMGSYPRSGNTLFRIILHHVYDIPTYSCQDDPEMFEHGVAEVMGHTKLPDLKVQLLRLHEYETDPQFIKTHAYGYDIPKAYKAVHIVRDGRAAVVSLAHRMVSKGRFNRSFPAALWNRVSAKGKWGHFAMSWYNRPNTVHIRFEDMLDNPIESVVGVVEKLNLDLVPDMSASIPSFVRLHRQYPSFFRKGDKKSWQKNMPEAFEKVFWNNNREAMETFGYVDN